MPHAEESFARNLQQKFECCTRNMRNKHADLFRVPSFY